MALTCPNGHVNDEGNRFCEQCGAPLQQPQADVAQPIAQAAPSAGATSSTCAVCGQENVPGTAFCDNCGAALPPPMPTSEEPAPSAPADAAMTSAPSATAGGSTLACPNCGTENDAANRFCDNCGAKLSGDAAAQPDAGQPAAVTADAQPEAAADQAAPEVQAGDSAAVAPDTSAAPAADTTPPAPDATATPPVSAEEAPPAALDPTLTAPDAAPAAIDPTLTAPEALPATATTDTSADRQRLEEEVRTQQQVVSQLEQMQTSLGAAMPTALVQSLDEARNKLAQAEADLQALPSAAPAPDPAEVARLEEEVRTQQQVVSQLEQMQTSLGAAMPTALVQSLDEARNKLAQAQADLQSLTGGASTSASAAQPAAPAPEAAPAQSQPAQPAQPAAPAIPSQPDASAAPVIVPATGGTNQLPPAPAQPQASGPRFVSRDGTVLSLSRTGGEIVIGRDDPISGIHPDVDLTPHGGEAGGVSRRHAVLRESNGQWLLTDLDSTNYTRIDGNRLTPDTPTPLHDGARVQFGRLEFDFHAA